ncbi:MAG: hypothetical protein JSW40_03295 [Candidatus Omnitrophota bacterium]|nr:MAG: hypothetical protein JSW40_03295 [Candidatus Omnitrophota bacterium]
MGQRRRIIRNSFFRCVIRISILLTGTLVNVCAVPAVENPLANHVAVYYFHGHFRCPTCLRMEQYAREAVEDNFRNELTSGKLTFKVVNVEEKGNEHFVNDYQLYTKSLVISLVENGKEVKYKNLDKIWAYARNKEKYIDYVKDEIGNFLK